MIKFLIPALVAATLLATASATTIEGVVIPPRVSVDGQSLQLNGAGLRTVVLLIVPIKAYVASFYTPAPIRSEAAALASPGPLQFNFTFLQGVSKKQVAEAWQAQFHTSVTYKYAGLPADTDAFIKAFGALKAMDTQTVEFSGTTTRMYENGALRGQVAGRDFQKAFLSMWFGSNPVQASLKKALLGL